MLWGSVGSSKQAIIEVDTLRQLVAALTTTECLVARGKSILEFI